MHTHRPTNLGEDEKGGKGGGGMSKPIGTPTHRPTHTRPIHAPSHAHRQTIPRTHLSKDEDGECAKVDGGVDGGHGGARRVQELVHLVLVHTCVLREHSA